MSNQSKDPLLDNAMDAISTLVKNHNDTMYYKKAFEKALVAASDHEQLVELDNWLERYINKLIKDGKMKKNSDLHHYLEKTIQDTFEPKHTENMEGGKKPKRSRKSKKIRKSKKNRKSRKYRKSKK